MPKTEYVEMSWQEISNLLKGQYTLTEVAQALNTTRARLTAGSLKIQKSAVENPQEFVRLIESSKKYTKPRPW